MKVQLIVVRGKPEGKVIPLAGPKFKIGRGETCHLRPNSEQVSREHAEFEIGPETVQVRDLGSRNGTLVNGKALTTESYKLKDRDLVQVGPLTFAVSILDAPDRRATAPKPAAAGARPLASPRPSPNPLRTTFPPTTSTPGCLARTPTRRPTSRRRFMVAIRSRSPRSRTAQAASPATEQAPFGRR